MYMYVIFYYLRIWEKFMAVIKANAPAGGLKQKLASWAKEKTLQGHKNMMDQYDG